MQAKQKDVQASRPQQLVALVHQRYLASSGVLLIVPVQEKMD